MSKILLLVLACLNLYASNIVENYRKSGADRAINEIEKELRSKEYWQEQLRDGDFEYGYYERDTNIIVTNKVAKNIKVFEYKNGKIKEVFANEGIITGIFGDKQKEGDLQHPTRVLLCL